MKPRAEGTVGSDWHLVESSRGETVATFRLSCSLSRVTEPGRAGWEEPWVDEAVKTGPQRGRILLDPTVQQFMPEGKSETELVVEGGMTAKDSRKEMLD